MKGKFALFSVIFFILSTNHTVQAMEHKLCPYIVADFGMEYAQNYLAASIVLDEMWAVFPRSEEGEPIFPAYYGGHFFDEEGWLVFKILTSLMAEAESCVFADIIKRDCVRVILVDFSHQELLDMLDVIQNFVIENPNSAIHIVTWGIDTPNNKVAVQVQGYNEETETIFKRDVVDSPMVTVGEGSPVKTLRRLEAKVIDSNTTEHLQPGMRIYIDNSGFSAGYPAARGQDVGFVTALHGLPLEEQAVRLGSLNGPLVGDVTIPIRFVGSVDGAFISLHGADFDQTVDNRALLRSDMRPAYGMLLTSVSTPPDGVTRTQRNITVTNSHFSANFGGGLILVDMIQTTGHALYGESGGIVFRPIGDDGLVKGVIVGSDAMSIDGQNMFFAWSEDINREINVTQK